MRGLLKVSSIISIWFLVTILILFGTTLVFTKISKTKSFDSLVSSTSNNVFKSPIEITSTPSEVLSAIRAEDARPVLVERFLKENNSPMVGMGKTFIEAADKYNLDWRLLPAIAFQESSLGKHTIFGSYNAFGWGVIDNTTIGASFNNWEHAIFTVARGLREDYFDKGLTTPATINPKYAGDKNWNVKVQYAMEEIVN